jgi:hypothetical protein
MAPCDKTVDTAGEFPPTADRPETGQGGQRGEVEICTSKLSNEFASSIIVGLGPSNPSHYYPSAQPNIMKMDWSPRSRTSNPLSRSPAPKKAGSTRVRAIHYMGNASMAYSGATVGSGTLVWMLRWRTERSATASDLGGECIPVMLVSSEGFVNGSATSRGRKLGNRPRDWALARWGSGGPRSEGVAGWSLTLGILLPRERLT